VDAGATQNPIPEDMLEVPGGEFTMGADGIGERDEQPAHKVTVSRFLLDITRSPTRSTGPAFRPRLASRTGTAWPRA
jgi:hypothetical protein